MADLTMRRKIIDLLIAEGPGFGFKTGKSKRKVTDSYTRVWRERVSEWSGDEEPDADGIRSDVKKKLDELNPRFEGISLALKPLLNPASGERGIK